VAGSSTSAAGSSHVAVASSTGSARALLAARLADAAQAGCDLAVMVTLPGSKSHENAQKRGFELLYTRAVLLREP
jgi:hypothetical protein